MSPVTVTPARTSARAPCRRVSRPSGGLREPAWYCGTQRTPAYPCSAAACSVQCGSYRCGRASAHRSARPAQNDRVDVVIATRSRRRRSSAARPRGGSGRRTASGNERPNAGRSSGETWPEDTSTMSHPCSEQHPRERDRVVGVEPARHPIGRRDPHAHRLVRRPDRAARVEHLERETRPVLQASRRTRRTRWFVSGERNDESRYPCAQCSSSRSNPASSSAERRPRELAADGLDVPARVISRGTWLRGAVRDRRRRDHLPVALRQRLVDPLPHQLRRALATRVADLGPDRAAPVGVAN